MTFLKLSPLLVVCGALATTACGAKSAETAAPATPAGETATAPHAAHAAVKAPGEATIGDTTKCPVSGEEFVVTADSPKVERGGKTYYFCCSGCKGKFESKPDTFLNKT